MLKLEHSSPNLEQEDIAQWVPSSGNSMSAVQTRKKALFPCIAEDTGSSTWVLMSSWIRSISYNLLVGALQLEIMTILMTSFVGHMRGCFRPPRDWYRDQWRELGTPGCSWLLSTSNGGWAPCSSCKLCRQKCDGGKRPQILARVSDDQAVVVWTRRRGRYRHLLRILVYILQYWQVWYVYY